VAVAGAGALGFADDAAACTRWASERGNDRHSGSAEAPYRTLRQLVRSIGSGQIGCLVAGSTFQERLVVNKAGVTIRTQGSPRALVVGGVLVIRGADSVRLEQLRIAGNRPRDPAIVEVRANGFQLVRSEVSGPYLLNRNTSCVLLESAAWTLLEGNQIHNCTRATTRRLYSPGIFVANADHTTIRHNFVYHTSGDAIVLAPAAMRSVVRNNLIDGNVSGVYLGGSSAENRVTSNIISYSGRFSVHGTPSGGGNFVARNCLWRGFQGNIRGTGYLTTGNLIVSPRYVDRPQTYRVRRGPCFGKRPYPRGVTASPRPRPVARKAAPPVRKAPARPVRRARPRMLPRFLVQYRLLALPDKVRVVNLGLIRLAPGSRVELRCVRGCGAVERRTATASGTVRTTHLRGRWLNRGALIEVRASRPGWVGHSVRVGIAGLPSGVRISHACTAPGSTSRVPCARFR
jgi:parallel beta-helix repeat protein